MARTQAAAIPARFHIRSLLSRSDRFASKAALIFRNRRAATDLGAALDVALATFRDQAPLFSRDRFGMRDCARLENRPGRTP